MTTSPLRVRAATLVGADEIASLHDHGIFSVAGTEKIP
jgi:hypothetical protein